MHLKVSHDQFEIDGNRLRHAPTGALFWIDDNDVVTFESGLAGTRMGTGHDYDAEELKQAAYEILKQQNLTCL
jgi:hypothetical protein